MGVLHLCFLFDVLVILYNRGNKAHKFLPCCRKRQDYKTKAFLFLFCRGKQSVSRHRTLCFIKQNKLFLYVETNCSFMLEQSVLPYWNTLFRLDKTDCSL